MPLKITCPECGRVHQNIDKSLFGKKFQCHCGKVVRLGQLSEDATRVEPLAAVADQLPPNFPAPPSREPARKANNRQPGNRKAQHGGPGDTSVTPTPVTVDGDEATGSTVSDANLDISQGAELEVPTRLIQRPNVASTSSDPGASICDSKPKPVRPSIELDDDQQTDAGDSSAGGFAAMVSRCQDRQRQEQDQSNASSVDAASASDSDVRSDSSPSDTRPDDGSH